MNDLELIAEAINNLNESKSWIEEYLYPVLGWLVALFTGYILTILALKINENFSCEKEKLYTSNEILIKVNSMVDSLVSIKNIYHGELTSCPIQRSIRIPFIPVIEEPMDFMLGKLSFIAQKESNKSNTGWRDIVRISSFFINFNRKRQANPIVDSLV